MAKTGDDPVIGFAGASYGGAVSLLVAGLDRRVDAIVPAFTLNRLDQALFPQYAVAGRRRVPGRRDAGRRRRGVQAGLGVAAVQRRRRRTESAGR